MGYYFKFVTKLTYSVQGKTNFLYFNLRNTVTFVITLKIIIYFMIDTQEI